MKTDILLKTYKSKHHSTKGRVDKQGTPIEFRLSFEEWCQLWQQADKQPSRTYVLSRTDDLGHYELGNVYIQHNLMNLTESSTSNSDYEQAVSQLAIELGYKRRIVRAMIKRGQITL